SRRRRARVARDAEASGAARRDAAQRRRRVSERFTAAWQLLPLYLSDHVLLSAAALGLGLALSFTLILAALRSAFVRWPVLVFASVVQTIPGLALLALFYPLLLALSAMSERAFGAGFSALGFLPALLALTLY